MRLLRGGFNAGSCCRETDIEKLREVCRKALRDCQEQEAAGRRLDSRIMRLERDKEVLGEAPTPLSSLTTLPELSKYVHILGFWACKC